VDGASGDENGFDSWASAAPGAMQKMSAAKPTANG